MPELRKDPIVERWVVVAPERANRPNEFRDQRFELNSEFDPFAEGHESESPYELLAYRADGSAPNGPGWRVRVVPNKYPALLIEGRQQSEDGLYRKLDGIGAHEVIIECPHGETNMSRLSVDNIREVLQAYRERLIDLKQDPRLAHALIFKNKGALAGASLPHSHSQLIATPVVPITILEELKGALDFYQDHGRSVFDVMIAKELSTGSRVVLDSPGFLAFCPYASRFAFETWIVPKQPGSHYENTRAAQVEELAGVLKSVLRKLEFALDDPPYNYLIHSAPFDQPELSHYSWHIEIFPRLTRVAGFEWGTGFYINDVPPEDAAMRLREVDA